jgi:hypothetical protein
VMMRASPDWGPAGFEDTEPENEFYARLVEDICRLCGIKFPPIERMSRSR